MLISECNELQRRIRRAEALGCDVVTIPTELARRLFVSEQAWRQAVDERQGEIFLGDQVFGPVRKRHENLVYLNMKGSTQ